LKHAIGEGRLAMIHMRDNTKISNFIHCAT
jgi:hypothetical protein